MLDTSFDAGTFTAGAATDAIIQPDNKVIVTGSFAKANGVPRRNIARFNPDGTLDTTFDPGTGIDFTPLNLRLQPDGKILVLGGFAVINGVTRAAGIARLHGDGSVDMGFDPGRVISMDGLDDGAGHATAPGAVYTAILQDDGKILVFGQFFFIITGPGTNVPRSCVARFNADGTFDPSFNPGLGFTTASGSPAAYVNGVVRQKIGPNADKIVALGNFDGYDGNPAPFLLRIDGNGAFDGTFAPSGVIPVADLNDIYAQSDDSIILYGGDIVMGTAPPRAVVRLGPNGAHDAGFVSPELKDYLDRGVVSGVAEQADGKLVVVGYFHSADGNPANNVIRLETNGARDMSFATGNAAGVSAFHVTAVAVRPSDQHVFLGGWFPTYDGVDRDNIAMVKATGVIDPEFAPTLGVNDNQPHIFGVIPQPDGKIVVGGLFTRLNGEALHNIVRLNEDGTRDLTFGITSGTSRSVRAMAPAPGGKIVITGNFSAIDGVARSRVARLNADGTVDPTFDVGTGPDDICYAVAVDSAGNVYVGGAFLNVNGIPRTRIVKFTPSGAVDTTFDPGSGFNGLVRAIAPPQGTAGPVVGGSFSTFNGSAASNIVRLDATTGARDPGFSAGFNSQVRALLGNPDGTYYVGGSFSTYTVGSPVGRARLARLLANGALDTTFVGPSVGGVVRALTRQTNDKVLAGGSITSPSLKQIARLSPAGALDTSFTTGSGAVSSPPNYFPSDNSAVDVLALQADGRLLAGGIFTEYNGTPRRSLVRLTDSLGFSAVSRRTHGGAGIFDIPLPATGLRGVECRTGGAAGDHQIVFNFVGPVTFQGASLQGAGSVASTSGNGTSTITVDLTGVGNAQHLSLSLLTVSDGLNTRDIPLPFSVLLGDTNGNGSVSASDVSQTKTQSGQATSSANFRSDVNLSGSINAGDIGLVKGQSGASLP